MPTKPKPKAKTKSKVSKPKTPPKPKGDIFGIQNGTRASFMKKVKDLKKLGYYKPSPE